MGAVEPEGKREEKVVGPAGSRSGAGCRQQARSAGVGSRQAEPTGTVSADLTRLGPAPPTVVTGVRSRPHRSGTADTCMAGSTSLGRCRASPCPDVGIVGGG